MTRCGRKTFTFSSISHTYECVCVHASIYLDVLTLHMKQYNNLCRAFIFRFCCSREWICWYRKSVSTGLLSGNAQDYVAGTENTTQAPNFPCHVPCTKNHNNYLLIIIFSKTIM